MRSELFLLACLFSIFHVPCSILHAQNTRLWSSYYGGTADETGNSTATDASGNVYLAGSTKSSNGISSGGFQNTFGGNQDAFLVKFDAAGNRLWATYYGGSGWEYGNHVTTDAAGNVYLTGGTTSTSGISSGGFQNTFGGGVFDAFLVKFDPAGTRIWATYYGGAVGSDWGYSISVDATGNVFFAGMTESPSGIASGGFQNTYAGGVSSGYGDDFLVKFNSAGNRLWATYYGGADDEYTPTVTADASGNVYLSGSTKSTSGISSGGFQNTIGGAYDGFLTKFDAATGARIWGTYYGGTGSDFGWDVATDPTGNVYLAGQTASNTNIASGGFLNTYGGGGWDSYLAKFNAAGVWLWGTYYGSNGDEWGCSTVTDVSGNVYLAGYTNSFSNISSGGFQNSNAGGWNDAFLVKFDASCARLCATYYGGTGGATGQDQGLSAALDPSGNIFITGSTDNLNNVASGGFQNTYGGGGGNGYAGESYLVKFTSCFNNILNVTVASSNILCYGPCSGTATVTPTSGTVPYTYAWSNAQTSSAITGLCAGSYSVLVTDATAATAIANVTITQPVILSATASATSASCGINNGTASVSAAGGTPGYTYLWNPTSATTSAISGLSAGNYSVAITDANGCTQTQTVSVAASNTFSLSATSTPSNCSGNNGTATAVPNGGGSPYTYSWSTTPVQTSATASGLASGTYSVNVIDAGGCTSTQTIAVSAAGTFSLSAVSTPAGCSVSNGTATAAIAGGTAPFTFLWNPIGVSTATATGLAAGNYSVTVTDANGCTQIQVVSVAQTSGPTGTASASPMSIASGASTTLTASGGGMYQWSPATGLSCTTCQSPTATPSQTTEYCVLVTDTSGCTDSICVTVYVEIPETPCGTLYIPNAFSPNNDLENDQECVVGNCIESMRIIIYNRWGEKVFESSDQAACWDGTYRNTPLDASVFTYHLQATLTSGEKVHKKGNISLVR